MNQTLLCCTLTALLLSSNSFAKKTKQNQGINNIVALSERLERENDPNYGDMYIQHKPKFQIIVLFADNKDRSAWLKSLNPNIRRYVQIRQAKKSRQQFLHEQDNFSQYIQKAGIKNYMLGYDIEQQRFNVSVNSTTEKAKVIEIAKKLNLDKDLTINVGGVAVREMR